MDRSRVTRNNPARLFFLLHIDDFPGLIDKPKRYFSYPDKIPSMKYYAIALVVIVVSGIFFTGCTQLSGTGPVTPAVPQTTLPTPEPTMLVPTAAATSAPQQVITIVRQVSQLKNIKDTELLFTLQVPVEWSVNTYRLNNADNSEGLEYQTDLVGDDVFYIRTFTVSRSQDQAYRDQFRKWSPAPAETTVTINEITYDRFESTSGSKTHVVYVARKGSANERGYASVIVFVADTGNRFEKEDFERVVSSFKYFPATDAGSLPGTEITRGNPPFDSSGSANSRTGNSGSESYGGCSRCGSS
jgi:hypothetical protein